jgi:hypothetical protein
MLFFQFAYSIEYLSSGVHGYYAKIAAKLNPKSSKCFNIYMYVTIVDICESDEQSVLHGTYTSYEQSCRLAVKD